MTYIEPTYENLKTELWKVVAYLEKDNILYRSVRDIKIINNIDKSIICAEFNISLSTLNRKLKKYKLI